MLFRPFRIELWLVLGFAAFLSNLGHGGGGLSWTGRFNRELGDEIGPNLHDFLHRPWLPWIAVVGVVALLILGVVLSWVGARGRFVFLDDVLHDRAVIVEPWKRYARLGNSLFVLQLVVGIGTLVLVLVLFGPTLFSVLRGVWRDGTIPDLHLGWLVIQGIVGAPLFISAALFHVLTRHFVVPVMWKHDLSAVAAWQRFGPLLARHPGGFLVYLLLLLVLVVGVVAAMLVLGFCTCCLGFLLMALPYVGSVALLPIHVTFRGFGPEFLSQFGPEWDARPGRVEPPAVPPVPPVWPGDASTG